MMEETKEWDRFWDSGRVEDYLRYKGCQELSQKEKETEKKPEKKEGENFC